ncbi:extracellular solute-binding protein [Catellatospora tritici]|uniref:extracellular solute-binding protein n=1 Tax=Catellatospora tritici TaxID=2851566 RepID=UPI001C2D97BF|nr:extracellular solute-binding protein [Catellatospora tritici]MBV1854880.1 extracellular solute-binding protein [Catellatospora tritici]
MKARLLAAAAAAALLLGVAACGDDAGSDDPNAGGELTVWLQVEAQNLWPKTVEATNAKLKEKYPNVKVTVAYQTWPEHLAKFDAAAQAGSAPDVIELGSTEMGLYMAAGAFSDLTAHRGEFDNNTTWVKALEDSATYQGKLYGIPYYGGDRAVIYRKDLLAEVGVTEPPTTWAGLMDLVNKLNAKHAKDPTFSSFFLPGQHQYAAMPFVYDAGGQAAKLGADGKWDATFSSPEGIAGLKNWKSLMDAGYKGDRTINDLTAFSTMVAGKAAMFYDSAGQMKKVFGADGDAKLKEQIGTFRLPSPTKADGFVPAFMGGSDVAVTAKSKHQEWARAWIAAYLGSGSQQAFVDAGFLANTKGIVPSDPQMKGYVDSLADTWTLPPAKNWAQVEKNKIVLNMLVDIATGKQTVEAATDAGDKAIEALLNAG